MDAEPNVPPPRGAGESEHEEAAGEREEKGRAAKKRRQGKAAGATAEVEGAAGGEEAEPEATTRAGRGRKAAAGEETAEGRKRVRFEVEDSGKPEGDGEPAEAEAARPVRKGTPRKAPREPPPPKTSRAREVVAPESESADGAEEEEEQRGVGARPSTLRPFSKAVVQLSSMRGVDRAAYVAKVQRATKLAPLLSLAEHEEDKLRHSFSAKATHIVVGNDLRRGYVFCLFNDFSMLNCLLFQFFSLSF